MESFLKFEIPESALRQAAELERLASEGVAVVPPASFIADFVKFQRAILGWKQDALASFADVSLSTIQRIERGESVSSASLNRVAVVLGQRSGAFTEPRLPLRGKELDQKVNDSFAKFRDRIWVPVRRLRTQPQVAALARTHLYLIDGGRLDDAYDNDIAALREGLDFLAFLLVTEEEGSITRCEPVKAVNTMPLSLVRYRRLNVAHALSRWPARIKRIPTRRSCRPQM